MPAHPPFIALPDPDAALLAQVKARYEAGEITVMEAARALGFSRQTLTNRITHKWFWRVPKRLAATKARSSLREAEKIAPKRAKRAIAVKPITRAERSPRALHHMVMVEIARLMRAIQANVGEDGLPIDPERHAKLMGAMVKLQADAVRLDEQIPPTRKERHRDGASAAANADDPAAPIDLARLRADLAQKLSCASEPGAAKDVSREPD